MTKDLLESDAFQEVLASNGVDPNSISEDDIKKVFNENKELASALYNLYKYNSGYAKILFFPISPIPGVPETYGEIPPPPFQLTQLGEVFSAVGEGMNKINEYAAENPKEAVMIQAGLVVMSLAAGGSVKGTVKAAATGFGYGMVFDQIADFIAPPVSASQTNRNLEEFNFEVEQGEEKQNNLLLGVSTSVAFIFGSVSIKNIKDIASFNKKSRVKNNSSAGKNNSSGGKTKSDQPLSSDEVSYTSLPKDRSLDDKQTRIWYDEQLKTIDSQIDKSLSLEDQAKQAFRLRNHYKQKARDLMSDRKMAEHLDRTKKIPTWDEQKNRAIDDLKKAGNKNPTEEQIYNQISGSAERSNQKVNEALGLTNKQNENRGK